MKFQFDSAHSPKSLKMLWENVLHPSINQDKWDHTEDSMLRKIATKYNFKYWEEISKELNVFLSHALIFQLIFL